MSTHNAAETLAKLQQALQSGSYSAIEYERLASAINAVYERLDKGDYGRFSHTENIFDSPNRARDFFTELQFHCYLGQTWSRLLKQLPIGPDTTVVDLCPGFNPKIEIGLFYADFTGSIDVIDASGESIEHLKKFMELFQPKFTIKEQVIDLFTEATPTYDIVLGNHIFDDLIMYYYTQQTGMSLDDIYASEAAMKDLWRQILAEAPAIQAAVISLITDTLQKVTRAGGFVCLTQYPSYTERMLDIGDVSAFNQAIAQSVSDQLQTAGFTSQPAKLAAAFADHQGHFGPEHCILLQRLTSAG